MKLLKNLGYKFIDIDYKEWDPLEFGKEQTDFIDKKLKELEEAEGKTIIGEEMKEVS
jgi:hypothetical protein